MPYGKGYYDTCCCCNCKISSGQLAFAILFTLGVISQGASLNFPFMVLDIPLVVMLYVSYCQRDIRKKKYGSKGVYTAKCAFVYSTVITAFATIAFIALFGIIMAGRYRVDLLTSYYYISVASYLPWRIW